MWTWYQQCYTVPLTCLAIRDYLGSKRLDSLSLCNFLFCSLIWKYSWQFVGAEKQINVEGIRKEEALESKLWDTGVGIFLTSTSGLANLGFTQAPIQWGGSYIRIKQPKLEADYSPTTSASLTCMKLYIQAPYAPSKHGLLSPNALSTIKIMLLWKRYGRVTNNKPEQMRCGQSLRFRAIVQRMSNRAKKNHKKSSSYPDPCLGVETRHLSNRYITAVPTWLDAKMVVLPPGWENWKLSHQDMSEALILQAVKRFELLPMYGQTEKPILWASHHRRLKQAKKYLEL